MVDHRLKLLPAYVGAHSIEQALADPRGRRLLWLEILVNDQVDLAPWMERPLVLDAYQKACRWFTTYRSLVTAYIPRQPLPVNPGPVDYREYRTVMEALYFVGTHH